MTSITQQTWNKVASLYLEKFEDVSEYAIALDRFCQLIPIRQPTLLEIGCGPGNLTKYIHNKRSDIQITAIDYAGNMIELAKQQVPAADFMVMDAMEIMQLNKKFDAILCGFCLPYLEMAAVEKLFSYFVKLLKGKGIVYCSFIEGDYALAGYKTASTGDEAYVYYFSEEQIATLGNKSNMKIVGSFKLPKTSKDQMPADECIMIFHQQM